MLSLMLFRNVLATFALVTAGFAQTVPAELVHEANVEYSNVGARVALDIVRPREASTAARPAVLLVHGGGFRRGARESYLPTAIKLAQRGYVAVTASYRLAPRHQFPAAIQDVKAAVRYLRANAGRLGIDPERIGAMGGSAGGQLVLLLGLTPHIEEFEGSGPHREFSSKVACVVNYYGPTDFTQSYSKSVDAAEVLPLYVGGDLVNARVANIRASPINWVTPLAAPVLSIHGTKDAFVAFEHSVWITERLLGAGVNAELETIAGAGHGFKGPDADRAEARAFDFFDRHLKTKAAQHRILISDHGPKGEIVSMEWPSGRELWTRANTRGHDVQSLPNGHVLFTLGGQKKVVELDEKQQEVWSFATGLQHPLAAQRLPNGNTLIGDAKAGRVLEVTPKGQTVWQYASPDIANMRMRNSHRTDAGTTLIAIEAVGKVIEVGSDGKIEWTWEAPDGENRRLYQARRLASGNTMVSLSDPGEIVEVDKAGKVVRSIAGKKMDVQFGWASGFATLPGGNLLVSDYTGRRLVEIDAAGKVVNELRTGPRTVASLDVID